jgi:hypothetical protein
MPRQNRWPRHWNTAVVADIRDCEQCRASFVPRREHARFCGVGCRDAWNREHLGDLRAGEWALGWSVTAMGEAAERLSRVRPRDQARAFAVIAEAVWWITIVDATLVRHHEDTYDGVMAGQSPAARDLIEGTLAGLRFVRNRISDQADLADFIDPCQPGPDVGEGVIAGWRWKLMPEPALVSVAPRVQAWRMSRYLAYQAHLAGHTTGQTFGRAAGFLKQAAVNTPSITDASVNSAVYTEPDVWVLRTLN